MMTVLVTGGIASGKSLVCSFLEESGYPVYDCDSRCKALYVSVPGLSDRIEEATGLPLSELGKVFGDPQALARLEDLVYPFLLADMEAWKASLSVDVCFVESAVALSKPMFNRCYDRVIVVTAPLEKRLERNPNTAGRMPFQQEDDLSRADYIIINSSTREHLRSDVESIIKSLKNEN